MQAKLLYSLKLLKTKVKYSERYAIISELRTIPQTSFELERI